MPRPTIRFLRRTARSVFNPGVLIVSVLTLFLVVLEMSVQVRTAVQQRGNTRQQRFSHNGRIDEEASAAELRRASDQVTEAPSGFDNLTNGFNEQGPAF